MWDTYSPQTGQIASSDFDPLGTATSDAEDMAENGNIKDLNYVTQNQHGTLETAPATDPLMSDHFLQDGNVTEGQTHGRVPLYPSSPPPWLSSSSLSFRYPPRPTSKWQRLRVGRAWLQGKGMLMVVMSQFFGASMNVMTQLLERDGVHGKAMHPFQILFTRMLITAIASYFYIWYSQVPNPFGARGIRWLLMLRAAGGFFGVFGMYFSLLYMPLSEATVLTFLSPIVACYAASFLMPNEPFTRKQQIAGVVSLLGVVFIARPFSGGKVTGENEILPEISRSGDVVSNNSTVLLLNNTMGEGPSAMHHLMAMGYGLLGVCGSACAFVTIRLIGLRAHPLVSVTYFSTYTTLVSLIAMVAIPSVSFRLPGNSTEWGLLLGLGVTGFTMQYLLTAGLAYQPPILVDMQKGQNRQQGNGSRATSMVYTQMLFALFFDKMVMNSSPSAISWAGSGLILGSALYVGVVRDSSVARGNEEEELDTVQRNDTMAPIDANDDGMQDIGELQEPLVLREYTDEIDEIEFFA